MGRMQQDSGMRSFDLRLSDGQWVRIAADLKPGAPALPSDFYVHLLVSLAIIVFVVMLVVRQATKPTTTRPGCGHPGPNLDTPPLSETGSTEM